MPAGRPSSFNPEIAEKIIDGLAAGMSLPKICEQENMPTINTVARWRAKDDNFDERCASARARGLSVRVEEMVDIADDVTIPPEHKKHMLAARQWMAEKLIPKYSRRVQLEGKLSLEQLVGASIPEAE
jgi:hypothetical protein